VHEQIKFVKQYVKRYLMRDAPKYDFGSAPSPIGDPSKGIGPLPGMGALNFSEMP